MIWFYGTPGIDLVGGLYELDQMVFTERRQRVGNLSEAILKQREEGSMKNFMSALKDFDLKQALYMLNQSIHLMGVIVEKLDEISMKLDRGDCVCSWTLPLGEEEEN